MYQVRMPYPGRVVCEGTLDFAASKHGQSRLYNPVPKFTRGAEVWHNKDWESSTHQASQSREQQTQCGLTIFAGERRAGARTAGIERAALFHCGGAETAHSKRRFLLDHVIVDCLAIGVRGDARAPAAGIQVLRLDPSVNVPPIDAVPIGGSPNTSADV